MKTKTRTFIGIVALGIIGFANINATTDSKRDVNVIAVNEAEENLNIESWMLENENWSAKPETEQTEPALEVESWMIEDEAFLNQNLKDPKLEVETWMLNENLWK